MSFNKTTAAYQKIGTIFPHTENSIGKIAKMVMQSSMAVEISQL